MTLSLLHGLLLAALLAPAVAPAPEPATPPPTPTQPALPSAPAPSVAPLPAAAPVDEPAPEDMSSAPATDSPVAISARVTPDPSQIGDLLELEVTVAYPTGYAVNVPLGLKLDPMHLVSVEESEPESTGQGLRKVFTFTIQHFAVGEAKTPSFPITYVAPDGAVQTAQVPSHNFTVTALLANEAEPKRQGEDPPISLEYPNHRAETAIYYTAGALVAGFVSALLWLRWRRRPRPVVLPPPEPADRVALRALDRLKEADYAGRGEFQLHYLMLTEILKGYLEGRFGIDALERTTDELRAALLRSEAAIAPLKPTEVIRFLQQCDLVKFARFAPPPSEASAAVEQARGMVVATTPVAPAGPKDQAPQDTSSGTGPKEQAPKDMSSSAAPKLVPESDIPTEPVPKFKEEGE
ncbi:hypothetical protein [Nannocystis punicea]|uniref:Oxygen tolerance n=1 Tax=Nannocystis punicea TaxID=2995304 RepID=A0ABY7HB46_9BACT|nr:hypothetical protein [Nannocystis poenicansa]WAS96274.1 hypothetical protein O0S08_08935 [Nannocystis poenicansa]